MQQIVQPKILSLLHLLNALYVVLPKAKPALKRKLTCNNAQLSAVVRPTKRCRRSKRYLSVILELGASDIQISQRNIFILLADPETFSDSREKSYIEYTIVQIYEELQLIEKRVVQDLICQ